MCCFEMNGQGASLWGAGNLKWQDGEGAPLGCQHTLLAAVHSVSLESSPPGLGLHGWLSTGTGVRGKVGGGYGM